MPVAVSPRRRSLVAVVLILALGVSAAGGAYAGHLFGDVQQSAFYHDDVSWLSATKITAGCGSGNFCPNDPVTRGQMAAFLHRLVGSTHAAAFTCPGSDFHADTGDTNFGTGVGVRRYRIDGSTIFRCSLVMPNGATLTKLSFVFADGSASGQIEGGVLYRTNMVTDIGTEVVLAQVAGTGVAATPGLVKLVDLTIATPVIDNANYAYYLLVTIAGTTDNVGVNGATLDYTFPGVPAP